MKKNNNKNKSKSKKENEGMDIDDAFADDEDVEYAEAKPRKIKKGGLSEKEIEYDIEEAEEELDGVDKILGNDNNEPVSIKASKPIGKIKKGDRILIDDKEYKADAHYVLIDHSNTKEMTIELFDNNDKDYQLRYFDDQIETTLELYELEEIMYVKKPMRNIEW